MMRFSIGQTVWITKWDAREAWIVCPDCAGTGCLRVTFADETTVSIGCSACGRGYEAPSGRIRVYERSPVARQTIITGVEVGAKTEWRTADSYIVEDENLFDNEADALARAKVIAVEADRDERDRVNHKEKDTRSWSWNAHYHRREIKEAEKRIEYHKAKLAVASLKAKEDRASKSTEAA